MAAFAAELRTCGPPCWAPIPCGDLAPAGDGNCAFAAFPGETGHDGATARPREIEYRVHRSVSGVRRGWPPEFRER